MSRNALHGTFGCAAVVAWLALFAAGLLIDSKPYRDRVNVAPTAAMAADAIGAAVAADPAPRVAAPGFAWDAFAGAMVTYTPLNAALLVILAGFVGGCASRLTYGSKLSADAPGSAATAEQLRAVQSARFLTESPLASMLRSFLVYLGIVAGVYVTAGQPFDHPTSDQYVRFVGTMSLLAFVVGYDPTKFQDLLSMVPRPGAR